MAKKSKTKTYIIRLARVFPATHKRAGEPTLFKQHLVIGDHCPVCEFRDTRLCLTTPCKRHTIRENYAYWEERIGNIRAGDGVLSIRDWKGDSPRSVQPEIRTVAGTMGVGIQRLTFDNGDINRPRVGDTPIQTYELALNDGLAEDDWRDWFKNYDLTKPMALIHFTPFRY